MSAELYAIDAEVPRAVARVRELRQRATHVVGFRNTSSVRKYVCNLCGAVVETDCARYAPTKRGLSAARRHAVRHDREARDEDLRLFLVELASAAEVAAAYCPDLDRAIASIVGGAP